MFIPVPKMATPVKGGNKLMVVPPIPLERSDHKKVPKTSYVTFKLRSNPTDTDSPVYDFSMQYFRDGSTEELLVCLKNIRKVMTGMNVTTGPTQYAMVRRVLQGDALSAFDASATIHGNETVENLKKCFEDLKKHVFPVNAYQRQRHYMNRILRKPKEMTIRQFMTRLSELNEYLGRFPDPSTNVTATKFSDHELTDIATNAIPNSWIKAMTYHNFDPLVHTPSDFTSFCERIEHVEGMGLTEKNSHTESSTSGTGKVQSRSQKGKRKSRQSQSNETSRWCVLHQTDTHDTNECKTLLAQAKKMRGAWEAGGVAKGNPNASPASNNHSHKKNVTWQKKPSDNYAFELGKMMMNILDQKAKEVQNHKQDLTENASTASEGNDTEDDRDSDDDVVMKEHYNIDKIDKFLNGTAKDPVTIDEAEEKKMSPETKKNSDGGSD